MGVQDCSGIVSLHTAAINNNTDKIKTLLNDGTNASFMDIVSNTVLDLHLGGITKEALRLLKY